MSHLPIWYLSQLETDHCDQFVAELTAADGSDAKMGVEGEQLHKQTRNTTVRFAPHDHWFTDVFERVAHEANRVCGWEYHITGREAIQLAEYGPDQHYTWHTDTFTLAGQPLDRKITVVALMNDEFEGGDFQVRLYQDYTPPLKKGSVIAFPSILEHRVMPVLSGQRYSATLWLNGPRFR